MDPVDDRSIGGLHPEHRDAIHGKLSASSDEDGSVGRPGSTSDHSIGEKGHSGPSSDDESRVEEGQWFEGAAPPNEGKKKHRRKQGGRHHRRPKPYERSGEDTVSKRRLLMQAPKNTTQYIMDDHPDSNSSPGTNANSTDETLDLETITRGMKEFDRQYSESMAQEYSQTYTKPELIQKIIELERRVAEKMMKQNK